LANSFYIIWSFEFSPGKAKHLGLCGFFMIGRHLDHGLAGLGYNQGFPAGGVFQQAREMGFGPVYIYFLQGATLALF
jgi:hypothetical protein